MLNRSSDPIQLAPAQLARKEALSQTFEVVERFIPLRGRRVFEVGCDRQFISAIEMIRMGAASVDCTNVIPIDVGPIAGIPNIRFHRIDSGASYFDDESFDVVYGRAVLEHIHDPAAIAAEVQRLLRPGGTFYLNGGPMWTSPRGHHVWVNAPSGISYTFPENNPFEHWEHLMYEKKEMQFRLGARGIPAGDAEAIVDHVYSSGDQSRRAPNEIISAFLAQTLLETLPIRMPVGGEPPTHITRYSRSDLNTGGLILIGRKNLDGDRVGDFQSFVRAGLALVQQRLVF